MNLRENNRKRGPGRQNNDNENKDDYNRFFKKKDQSKYNIKRPEITFNIEQTNFPVLLETKTHTNNMSNSNNITESFAKMAALPKIIESVVEEVKPGHVSIYYDKQTRTIQSKYGDKTAEFIAYENTERIKNSLQYGMNAAIERINANQKRRIQYYDEVHGEGSYNEMFNRRIYDDDELDDDIDENVNDDSETE